LAFFIVCIKWNTVNRANDDTLRFVIVTNALCTFFRVNYVNFVPRGNGFVRALRFAYIAVNAFICDD